MEWFFIVPWAIVAAVLGCISCYLMYEGSDSYDEEETRLGARMFLLAPLWPLALPAALYWVLCKAFGWHFPSLTKEKVR